MGFFSDLKEDLSQAVNELLPEEAAEEKALNPELLQEEPGDASAGEMNLSGVNLSDMLDKMEAMDLEAEESTEVPVPEESSAAAADELITEEPVIEEPIAEAPEAEEPIMEELVTEEPAAEEPMIEEPVIEEPVAEEPVIEEPVIEEPVGEEAALEAALDNMITAVDNKENIGESTMADNKANYEMEERTERKVATDETALITAGMTIRGDIETEGSMDLIGKVIGNVDVLGKMNITGTIEGNSKASEIYAEKAHIIGEVRSEGAVKIGQNSVIIGNVFGNSAVVAGAVKGDIDIKGPVILDSTAIVMGNIKSKSVQINNGAVIEGMCSQCYADVTPTSFFDDFKLD